MLQDLCFLLTVFLPSLWSSWWFDLWRSRGRGETREEKKLLVVSVDFEGWRGEKMEAAGWNKLRVLAERSTRDTAAGFSEGCSSTGWKFDNELARLIIYCEIIDKRLPLNLAAHSGGYWHLFGSGNVEFSEVQSGKFKILLLLFYNGWKPFELYFIYFIWTLFLCFSILVF